DFCVGVDAGKPVGRCSFGGGGCCRFADGCWPMLRATPVQRRSTANRQDRRAFDTGFRPKISSLHERQTYEFGWTIRPSPDGFRNKLSPRACRQESHASAVLRLAERGAGLDKSVLRRRRPGVERERLAEVIGRGGRIGGLQADQAE